MTARNRSIVIGVDTHAETHTAAAVDELGWELDVIEIPSNIAGYRQLLRWARALGDVGRVGVEGTGAYGAGLTRFLAEHDVSVIEVNRVNRQHRRRRGKSDPADAVAAARAVLAGDADAIPKDTTGRVEAIRVLHLTRRSAVKAKSQASNQIRDLLVTAPEPIRAQLRDLTVLQRVRLAARWRPGPAVDPATATRTAIRSLAQRWLALHHEIHDLDRQLAALVQHTCPSLLAEQGVGIDVAAKLLIAAGDNPQRLRTEAAFAALCGVSPVDASTGKHTRHRLNRGGNRQANSALHTVALVRAQHCPETRRYIEQHRNNGYTDREIRRCLKRALARRFHRLILNDLTNHLT